MRVPTFAVLAAAMLLPLAAGAQALDAGLASGDAFNISVAPQFLMPGTTATLSFLSSSLDLTNATINVTAGGKSIYAGAVRPVSLQLGKAGSLTRISTTVTAGGASYSQSLTLQPEDVVLVAEPVATAPALYPGKPSVPLEGNVRVVAMPAMRSASGALLNAASLAYAWSVDDTSIPNSSGIGRNTLIVSSPMQYRSRTVSVTVTSNDGTITGGASVTLSPVDPVVRIYQNDPLLGLRFDHALTNQYSITGSEASLFASPFSLASGTVEPSIAWFLNGAPAQTGNSITLRPTGSGQGQASLSVVASVSDATKATDNLSVIFGAKPSANFFGL